MQQIGKKYSYGDSISGLDTACKPLRHLAKGMMMRNKNDYFSVSTTYSDCVPMRNLPPQMPMPLVT